MKASILILIMVVVGIIFASADSLRTTFYYTNQLNSGVYTQVISYDGGNCSGSISTLPCSFDSPVVVSAPATQAKLIAAGAIPSSARMIYVP